MANVLKFEDNITRMIADARKKYEDGQHLKSLDVWNRIDELLSKMEIKGDKIEWYESIQEQELVSKVQIYMSMGLFKKALQFYYNNYDFFYHISPRDMFEGIILCCIKEQMSQQVDYYTNFVLEKEIVDDAEIVDFFDPLLEIDNIYEEKHPTPMHLDERILNDAQSAFIDKNYEKAVELILTIKPNTDSFLDANIMLVAYYISIEDYPAALSRLELMQSTKYSDPDFVYTEKDVDYLVVWADYYCFTEDEKNLQKYCDIIAGIEISSSELVVEVLRSMMRYGRDDLVYKYSTLVSKMPLGKYSIHNMYTHAFSAFNLGYYEEARAKFLDLCTLDPNDILSKEHLKTCFNNINNAGEMSELEALLKGGNPKIEFKGIKRITDPDEIAKAEAAMLNRETPGIKFKDSPILNNLIKLDDDIELEDVIKLDDTIDLKSLLNIDGNELDSLLSANGNELPNLINENNADIQDLLKNNENIVELDDQALLELLKGNSSDFSVEFRRPHIDYRNPYPHNFYKKLTDIYKILDSKEESDLDSLFEYEDTVMWLLKDSDDIPRARLFCDWFVRTHPNVDPGQNLYNDYLEHLMWLVRSIGLNKEWGDNIDDILLSFATSNLIKVNALETFLITFSKHFYKKNNKTFSVRANIDGYYVEYWPTCPKIASDMIDYFMQTYWKVYAILAFKYIHTPFEKNLYNKFEKFATTLQSVQFKITDSHALAACFAYYHGDPEIFADLEACINIFDADEEAVKEYNKLLHSQVKMSLKSDSKKSSVKSKSTTSSKSKTVKKADTKTKDSTKSTAKSTKSKTKKTVSAEKAFELIDDAYEEAFGFGMENQLDSLKDVSSMVVVMDRVQSFYKVLENAGPDLFTSYALAETENTKNTDEDIDETKNLIVDKKNKLDYLEKWVEYYMDQLKKSMDKNIWE